MLSRAGAGRDRLILGSAIATVLTLVVFLRFWTPSQLWLDEALTVDIARLPLAAIPHALREDGAPPLYYFLLHFWMGVFGSGNLGARSLSGVLGLVNLPLAYLAGWRIAARPWRPSFVAHEGGEISDANRSRGRIAGWTVALLLATSPFAIYYDTESRMYALVILLTTTGLLAFTSMMRRLWWGPVVGLGVSAALLLYTQYWALYVLAAAGAGFVWCSWRGPFRRECRLAVAALAAAALSFVPWLGIFWFQLHHTGTPWTTPADWTALVFTMTQFAGGNSTPGRALAIVFFFLAVLALFGAPAASGGSRVELELRTRPGVRALSGVVVATLVVAVALGKVTGSAFADRYTAVVVLPSLLVVAYGVTTIASRTARLAVVGVAVVLGLAAAVPNAYITRTQAGAVGDAVSSRAAAGDVVAYCPDQLGPAVARVIGSESRRSSRVPEVTYPRRTAPAFVDWIDYARVNGDASPLRFAQYVEGLAGPEHAIWYVSAPGYLTFGNACGEIAADLTAMGRPSSLVVAQAPSDTPFEIFEGESLVRFGPS